ncbi:flagellar biosynthetic protein FliR [Austwickia chelonae]|uniref:Flagellar biosynthetic protein FliR n=1 Tax=Austwickia chelonae NBRC 105200 TaxID=1184607 RepID=K6V6B3_9MICO|nr:flagellar biosynthetic protein FliR [Austwickia chelonae]GAB77773.1 flagellar biosynthetic protein FliR [Austwickia chelonae NBRC 105200]SEV89208.1 flagellar biosynthetic protein FliR [Austwickia chelonae]
MNGAAPMALGVSAPYDLLIAHLLVMVRVLAFLVVAPPFNGRTVPMRVKGALAMAISFALAPTVAGSATFPDMPSLVWAVTYHFLTGAFMGFVALVFFSAVQAAGDLVDLFSMFTMSQLLDPMSNTQSGVFGRIEYLIGTTLLVASGGHLVMLRGLLTSFHLAPMHPPLWGDVARMGVSNLSTFFVAAMEISGPIVVVLVLADLALGLVSRAVPSLNIFQLAFPVKTVLTVALASVAVSLLPSAVSMLVGRVVDEMVPIDRFFGG